MAAKTTTTSIVEMLESLDEGTDVPDSESVSSIRGFDRLPKSERLAKIFDLKMRGVPVTAIAKTLGVDASTVHRNLKEYAEEYRKRLEQEPPANLIADACTFYDEIERVCLFEAEQAGGGSTYSSTTGKVERKYNGEKLQYIQAAKNARDSKLRLLLETGIIPKEPERMYHALRDDSKTKTEVETSSRSDEELRNSVINLVKKMRSL